MPDTALMQFLLYIKVNVYLYGWILSARLMNGAVYTHMFWCYECCVFQCSGKPCSPFNLFVFKFTYLI